MRTGPHSGPHCDPRTCVDELAPRVGAPCRAARLGGLAQAGLLGLVAVWPVTLLPAGGQRALMRLWTRTCLALLGVRMQVEDRSGAPGEGGELLVANHVSWLDVAVIAPLRPGRIVAKSEAGDWPAALRAPMRRAGVVFFDRARPRALPGAVADLAGLLRAGARVIVFPEGTSYCGVHAGGFHPALFQAAIDAGAAVQPVRIRYRQVGGAAATGASFIGDDGFPGSVARIAGLRGLTAHITLLPRIAHAAGRDRRTLARLAEDAVRTADHAEAGDPRVGPAGQAPDRPSPSI